MKENRIHKRKFFFFWKVTCFSLYGKSSVKFCCNRSLAVYFGKFCILKRKRFHWIYLDQNLFALSFWINFWKISILNLVINSDQSVLNYFSKLCVSTAISIFEKLVFNAKFVPPLLSNSNPCVYKLILVNWLILKIVKIIGKLLLFIWVNFSFLNSILTSFN